MPEGDSSGLHCLPDEIRDMAVDDGGLWLAVATSDGAHIYTAGGDEPIPPTDSSGPSGRDWSYVCTVGNPGEAMHCVAWAPASFYSGAALVGCSSSGLVFLWRSVAPVGKFEVVYQAALPSPGWRVAWAPEVYGRIFAVGASDGTVTSFCGVEGAWIKETFAANTQQLPVLDLSFAPFLPSNALLSIPLNVHAPPQIAPLQLAVCGEGASVSLWARTFSGGENSGAASWHFTASLPIPAGTFHGAASWREVAWAKNNGLPFHYIAAGSTEGFLAVWVFTEESWRLAFSDASVAAPVTRLSWSEVGSFLLVSYGDGAVRMWRETPLDGWQIASQLD